MHHRDNVIYSLRYRRMNGGVDEEKESEISEWKEQTLEKGLDQYILRGLCSDSSYHVSARYQWLEKMLWSASSETVYVNTYSEKKKAALVFAYWWRTTMSHMNMSANMLVDIMQRYSFEWRFEWDSERTHKDIELSNHNQTLKHTRIGDRIAVSKNELSSEYMDAAMIEFTLQGIPDGVSDLMIGFVDSSDVHRVRLSTFISQSERPKVCTYCNVLPVDTVISKIAASVCFYICYDPKECAVQIYRSRFSKRERDRATPIDVTSGNHWRGCDCKNGDRILMSFDFVHSRCMVTYNEREVGTLTDNLPNQIYVLANPDRPTLTLETTRFEVIPKV